MKIQIKSLFRLTLSLVFFSNLWTAPVQLVMMFSHSISFAASQWNITQLTDNDYDECPSLKLNNNGFVSWKGWCNTAEDTELFLYDGMTTLQITDNSSEEYWHSMNDNGKIVWHQGTVELGTKICMYDYESRTTSVISYIGGILTDINNNDVVVWDGWDQEGFDKDIFLYDGSSVTNISDSSYHEEKAAINDNGYVSWIGAPDGSNWIVFLYDGSSVIWQSAYHGPPTGPFINNNNQVTWRAGECPFDCEIYFYDGTTTHQLTDNIFDDRGPRINDLGQVTWWGYYGANIEDFKIFLYDDGAIREIGAGNARHPDINDSGMVVWQQQDGDDLDIFLFDGSQTHQITNDCQFDDERPIINDNAVVVWYRYDGTDYEIMMADPTQVAETQWAKTLGGLENEQAAAVEKTPAGGYVVVGETDSYGAGGKDLWIIKLDKDGGGLWQKAYGGPQHESAAAITAAPDGGYLVVGSTDSVTSGESDAWLLKIDESGAVEWSRSYGGTANDSALAVVLSGDCNYMVGGRSTDPFSGDWDIWLMKLEEGGNMLWRKTYDGSAYDSLSSLQRTQEGGFILAGETHAVAERNGDFWVLKVDKDGIVEWEKAYGLDVFVTPEDPRNENTEYKPSIQQTSDGGYILAGTTVPYTGKHMVWLLKLTNDGTISWEKLFSAPGDCNLSYVQQTDDSGYLLSGETGSEGDGWLMKLDENGVKEWVNDYGGEGPAFGDTISFFQKTPDGGYIAVGYTESLAASEEDLWILKLDGNGYILECPPIQPGFLVAEADPSEEPVGVTAGVSDDLPISLFWTVTVTNPPSEHVFEGDGCNKLMDLIDLPRTGQTTPYHAGDDGHIQAGTPWPLPRFVDNGNGTVTDTLTGLMWLKDANCANSAGYDPNATENGQVAWERALDFVAGINDGTIDISLCSGYSLTYDDWRLANVNEMETLIHSGVTDRAGWLNSQGFDNVQYYTYWTSTPCTGIIYPRNVFVAEFDTGRIHSRDKDYNYYAWPVRAGQQGYPDPNYPANVWRTGRTGSRYPGDDGDVQAGVAWPSNRFTDHGDGTVTDNLTGLMWLQDASCLGVPQWDGAMDKVAEFNTTPEPYDCLNYAANHDDWRLPNRKELRSLVDNQYDPPLPEGHPFVGVPRPYPQNFYWTSNTNPSATNTAWRVRLGALPTTEALIKSNWASVWPVRGGIHGNAVRDADFDGDGDVDGRDLGLLVVAFGSHIGEDNFNPVTDLVGDNTIDGADLQAFIPHLGRTDCPCQ